MPDFQCLRCGARGPALSAAPMPGRYGEAILARTCAECWRAWQEEQTRVMNHYGLRPHVPQDREQLYRHMSEFLQLEEPAG